MTRIGKYEIESEVNAAKDSRIRVFRAMDGDTGRAVTLKLLAKRGDRFADRFRSEVSHVARLRVPSVIVIYELGEHEGCPFVVMPDLGTDHLGLAIEDKRSLTLLEKSLILEQVATGAAEMHRGGLAYLGIRPRAVALTDDGAVIQDFGVVHLVDAHGESLYLSAEESNSGFPPDSLCDIFAFGVVCYQFLAGVHPFRTSAGEALARDARRPPALLGEAAADCPEKLEELASRLLEARRDFRYQTFDDVLDDLHPIVQSLKRAQAANLRTDGRRLMREGKLEEAQSIVRQALWLHPDDSDAGQISADLGALMRERRLRARIEDLWQQAEQAAANRRFFRAVELLTTACRLDEAGLGTQSRLEAMQTRLDNSVAASEFTFKARLLWEQGQLEQARATAGAALERDPEEPEALQLRDLIESALARQNRLQSVTSEAGVLLSEQRFADAVRVLESAGPELSSDPGVSDLLSRARAAVAQAKAVEQVLARCHELRAANRFDQAMDELNRGLTCFPDEAALRGLRSDVQAQAESYRRTEAVREALDEVQWLLAEDRPDLAVGFLKQSNRALSSEPALQARLAEVEQKLAGWEHRRLLKCLQDFCSRADGEGRFDWAVALLPVLDSLLSAEPPADVAEAAKRLRKRIRVHAIVGEVRVYLAAGAIDRAEEALHRELNSGEESPLLAMAQKEVEVCREYLGERQRAQVSLGRHQLAEAEDILARLAAPDRAEVQTLLEVVRARRNATDDAQFRENVRERARKMIDDGSQDEAGDLLRNLAILFPGEPALPPDGPASADKPRPLRAPASRPISSAVPLTASISQKEPWEGFRSRMKGILVPVSSRVPKVAFIAGLITLSAASAAIWRFTRGAAPTAAARIVFVPSVVRGSSSLPAPAGAQMSPAVPAQAERGPAAAVDRAADNSSSGGRAARHAPEAQRPLPRAFVNPNASPASAVSAGPVSLPAPPSAAAGSLALDAPAVPVVIGQVALRADAPAPPKSAPAAPAPPARSGKVQLPKLISGPAPAFPILARQQHVSGTVDVEAVIDKQGYVKSIASVHGNPILTKAATQAVAGWRFQPASIDGDPVEAKTTVTLRFENPPR